VQRALEGSEDVADDAIAGHALEIEIATARAVDKADVPHRHHPG